MLRLALALCLLAGNGWTVALAPGTFALYFDSTKCSGKTTDCTGNNNLTEAGTVPYGNQGQPIGTSAAGPFSTLNHFRQNDSLPLAWFNTANSWTIQAYLKAPTTAGYTMVGNDRATNGVDFMVNIVNPGGTYFDNGAANVINATVLADDTWRHFAWTWNGTNLRLYIDNVLIYTSAVSGAMDSSDGPVTIGVYHTLATFALNGYLNQLRFMNTVETSFPTVDPSGALNNRSPYINLFLYPEQGLLKRLGALFAMLALPSQAKAHVQDQRVQQRVVEQKFIDWEVRTNRITKTRTLTPKATQTPRSGTPTRTATATPTPDPSKLTPTRTPSRVELEARER